MSHKPPGCPSVVLAGTGGFGKHYLARLLREMNAGRLYVSGLVDPSPPTDSGDYQELLAKQARSYPSLEEFYAETPADLAILCTPIQTHRPLTELALSHGSHVLCEKPAAVLVSDVESMIAARDRAQRRVAVGFQWSFADEIIALKHRIMQAEFGRPRRFRVLVKWPRGRQYYTRAAWAGRLQLDNGDWVLDGSAANAHSHFLHNMLYLLGDRLETSASPLRVQAELYRANSIESYDTAALRICCQNDVELLFYSTHASDPGKGEYGPHCIYEFEKATLVRKDSGAVDHGPFLIVKPDGTLESLAPDTDMMKKIPRVLETITGEGPQLCGLEAALPQVQCINAMHTSSPRIATLPNIRTVELNGQHWVWSPAADQDLDLCFETGSLPSETGHSWATAGQLIDMQDHCCPVD